MDLQGGYQTCWVYRALRKLCGIVEARGKPRPWGA